MTRVELVLVTEVVALEDLAQLVLCEVVGVQVQVLLEQVQLFLGEVVTVEIDLLLLAGLLPSLQF